jgi:hypothetical protein
MGVTFSQMLNGSGDHVLLLIGWTTLVGLLSWENFGLGHGSLSRVWDLC